MNYDQNVISFQYAALDMASSEYRTYAYQLVGFDTGWQYVGKKREVTFTNLAPGKYSLKMKSANQNGKWHEMANPLDIIILAPWWRTCGLILYTYCYLRQFFGYLLLIVPAV